MSKSLLIALGSNLSDAAGRPPLENCRWALERLAEVPGLRLERSSRWYGTSPVPASDQPDYVNGAARFSGEVEPWALLATLHALEAEAGRVRAAPNAARVLDLDLLAVDDLVLPGPGLVLPHPRLSERAFVLYPLCDVAPGWRHPLLGRTASELRDGVSPDGITAIETV